MCRSFVLCLLLVFGVALENVFCEPIAGCGENSATHTNCRHTVESKTLIQRILYDAVSSENELEEPTAHRTKREACDNTAKSKDFPNKKKNYYFVPRQMTWNTAVKHCARNCSALATITDHVDHLQFHAQVTSRMKGIRRQPWVGGKCEYNHDCRWHDTDASIGYPHFRHWQSGEPDTFYGEFKCMRIVGDVEDHWRLSRCTEQRPFACQYFTQDTDDE